MKTMLFLISMVLLSAPLSAMIEVTAVKGTKKMAISMDEINKPAKIELLDPQGIILTSTKVKSSSYHSIFDLSTLPEGKYFLSIFLNNKEWMQPIVIKTDDLFIDKKAVREYFSPVFNTNSNKLDLVLFNQFLSPVEIQILNQNGQPVFNEKLGSVLRVEKRFDLSQLETGTYTVVVSAHDRYYYHTIKQ
jgi:hypothetical protein